MHIAFAFFVGVSVLFSHPNSLAHSRTWTVPAGWSEATHLFGSHHTLLSPERESSRAVAIINSIGESKTTWNTQELESKQSEYREGREKYLSTIQGTALAWDGFQLLDQSQLTRYQLGYRFLINGITFQENSYYFYCKKTKSVTHIKTLIRRELEKEFSDSLNSIVESFRCEASP